MKKSDKRTERAIIKILSDFIIWQRIERGMFHILNAHDPRNAVNEFPVEPKYNGYATSFILLGIEDDEDLCEKLSDIVWDHYDSKDNSEELAKKVYIDWLVEIKDHYTEREKEIYREGVSMG